MAVISERKRAAAALTDAKPETIVKVTNDPGFVEATAKLSELQAERARLEAELQTTGDSAAVDAAALLRGDDLQVDDGERRLLSRKLAACDRAIPLQRAEVERVRSAAADRVSAALRAGLQEKRAAAIAAGQAFYNCLVAYLADVKALEHAGGIARRSDGLYAFAGRPIEQLPYHLRRWFDDIAHK